jgi:amino acid adenylation domain-containing protein
MDTNQIIPLSRAQLDLWIDGEIRGHSFHRVGTFLRLGTSKSIEQVVDAYYEVFELEPNENLVPALVDSGECIGLTIPAASKRETIVIRNVPVDKVSERFHYEILRATPPELIFDHRLILIQDQEGQIWLGRSLQHLNADGVSSRKAFLRAISKLTSGRIRPALKSTSIGEPIAFDEANHRRYWTKLLSRFGKISLGSGRLNTASPPESSSMTINGPRLKNLRAWCTQNHLHISDLFRVVLGLALDRFQREHQPGGMPGIVIRNTRPKDSPWLGGCQVDWLPTPFCSSSWRNQEQQITSLVELCRHWREKHPTEGSRRPPSGIERSEIINSSISTPGSGGWIIYNWFKPAEVKNVEGEMVALNFVLNTRPEDFYFYAYDSPKRSELLIELHTGWDVDCNAVITSMNSMITDIIDRGAKKVGDLKPTRDLPVSLQLAIKQYRVGTVSLALERLITISRNYPNETALSTIDRSISYKELINSIGSAAAALTASGLKPGGRVGIHLSTSPELVIAQYACWWAGLSFLALDPTHPKARITGLLAQHSTDAVITDISNPTTCEEPISGEKYLSKNIRVFNIHNILNHSEDCPTIPTSPESEAYLIHTSGSSGMPKGVSVSHHSLARLFECLKKTIASQVGDKWIVCHSPSFDFSIWEIHGALTSGAELHLTPPCNWRDPKILADIIRERGITILNQTPSAFPLVRDALLDHSDLDAIKIRWILFGGEALNSSALTPWWNKIPKSRCRVANLYGITETTIHTTWKELLPDAQTRPSSGGWIGAPLDDLTIGLSDDLDRIVPVGVSGEIRIHGDGLARGYLNDPVTTDKHFTSWPDAPTQGRYYRSGDIARLEPDHGLEYLGRLDRQIQLRGHRVEPAEIEHLLKQHPGIQEIIVSTRTSSSGEASLIGYYIPTSAGTDLDEIEALLEKHLPSYLARFPLVKLKEFPLTNNGKLDIARLPEPNLDTDEKESPDNVSPRLRRIAELMAEVLRIPRISYDGNFFRHGGHSLRAAELSAKLNAEWQTQVPVGSVLRHPTPRQLCEWIDQHSDIDRMQSVLPGLAKNKPVLSPAQKRVLAILEAYPSNRAYQFQARIDIKGPIDVSLLNQTLTAIVARHAGLRLSFTRSENQWTPKILNPWNIELRSEIIDENKISSTLDHLWLQTTPLEDTPLIQWDLFRITESYHILAHREHHLIHDGRSFQILLHDIKNLYKSPFEFPSAVPSSFDWAVVQNSWLECRDADRQRLFWKQQLANVPSTSTLPPDWLRPPLQSHDGGLIKLEINREQFENLTKSAANHQRTIHADGMCAFALALMEQSGQTDFCIGSGVANRQWPGSEQVVGMLLNNLSMRFAFTPDMSLADAAAMVLKQIQSALDHQELPFDEQVQLSESPREPGTPRLCQAFYTSYFGGMSATKLGDATIEIHPGESNRSAKFDLNLILANLPRENGEQPILLAEYNSNLYLRSSIQQFLERWWNILNAIHSHPEAACDSFPGFESKQSDRTSSTQTREHNTSDILSEALSRSLGSDDLTPSIELGSRIWTKADVNQLTIIGMTRLHEAGVKSGDRVALILDRGPFQILWTLAILRIGACVVPLDSSDPKNRLIDLIKRSRAKIVISNHNIQFDDPLSAIIWNEALLENSDDDVEEIPWAKPGDSAEAFLFFTSGTTAKPKGVIIPRQAPAQLSTSLDQLSPVGGKVPRVLQLAPPAFDASTFETFFPLLRGGCIVCAENELHDAGSVAKLIKKHQVTTLWLTSTLFNTLINQKRGFALNLDALIIGGERLKVDSVARLIDRCPEIRVFNGYGPTENCTFTTIHRIVPDDLRRANGIPIGTPLVGRPVSIETPDGHPVPPGAVGELVCRGLGLAKGYLDNDSNAFQQAKNGESIYRTGDLVRLASDGVIEYLGRIDSEIKLRGHRVSPIILEHCLISQNFVQDAVALVDSFGDSIDGYVILHHGIPSDSPVDLALREHCRANLPKSLQPRHLFVVDNFPKTTNGKLDLVKLRATAQPFKIAENNISGPTTITEQRVQDIFNEILEIKDSPADKSFFDLGGHSLLAMRLRTELETEFKNTIPLGELLENATPKHIAQILLERDSQKTEWKHALPIKRRGTQPILWWTAGGDGGEGALLTYAAMSPHLAKEQPFWGLRAAGIDRPKERLHASVGEMARQYADEIEIIQPEGPYRIGGECLAGTVAWELATELVRRGKSVDRLVLLDSYPPSPPRRRRHQWWRSHCKLRSLLKSKLSKDWYLTLSKRLPIPEDVAPATVQSSWIQYQKTLLASNPRSTLSGVRVIELRSDAEIEKFPCSGWRALAPHLETVPLRGDHHSYIRGELSSNSPILRKAISDNENFFGHTSTVSV